MSAVHPRKRGQRRPNYLPTAVEERLSQPTLPSDGISSWDRQRLAHRGVDLNVIDALAVDIVRVKMRLPKIPVPNTPMKTYNPSPAAGVSKSPSSDN